MARQRFEITKKAEGVILKYYNKMREQDICDLAKISRFQLQRFKRENGLFKSKGHQLAKVVELKDNGYFRHTTNWI